MQSSFRTYRADKANSYRVDHDAISDRRAKEADYLVSNKTDNTKTR